MPDIAVAHDTSPFVSAYPWDLGFGAKYANPAILPTGTGYGVAFCGNTDVAVAHDISPFVSAYPWTPGTGFGVKYANPATLPTGMGRGVAFCRSTDIAVAHDTSPFVSAYPWTPGVGFGVKYADPATLPTGIGYGVAFCGITDIAVAHNTSPYVTAYPWNPGTGFGVKYANPATLPTGMGRGVAFCRSTDIAVAHHTSPYVTAYPWTPGVGFGVKYADPATLPTGNGYGVAYCKSTDLAVAHDTGPFVSAYPWTPGTNKYLVERGTITLGAGVATQTVNLTTPVTVGKSFVIASCNATQTNLQSALARVQLTTVVGDRYTQVTATRSGTVGTTTIAWQIISGNSFTVQSGTTTVTAATTTVNITAVNLSSSFIVSSQSQSIAYIGHRYGIYRQRFTSNTQIEFRKGDTGGSGSPTVDWYVVQWNGASVQSNTVTLASPGWAVSQAISEIVRAKTFLLFSCYSAPNIYEHYVAAFKMKGFMNTTTSVYFDRGGSNTGSIFLAYFVVSHPDINVQYNPLTVAAAALSATGALGDDVDMNRTFMATNSEGNGKADNTANQLWHCLAATHAVSAANQITVTKGATGLNLFAYWYAVEFIEGFGVKYADPATLPANTGYGVAFCGNKDVAVAHDTSPFVSAYPWTPGTGFGVKYADPATLPTGTGYGVAFTAEEGGLAMRTANMGAKLIAGQLI